MGKKNSKLKDDTLDQLCADTYCKYKNSYLHFYVLILYINQNRSFAKST